VLGGRRGRTELPRSRSRENTEIELETCQVFSSPDVLDFLVVERGPVGVAIGVNKSNQCEPTSRHAPDLCPGRLCLGASSEPPRRHVGALVAEPGELDVAVLMIDGLEVAGHPPAPG
jgi:hypothetical protein